MTDSPSPPPRWADGAALAALALLTLFFFWRLVAPNPADRLSFPIGDFTDQYYPLRHFAAAALAEGQIPQWNPYHRGGAPGLADPQAALLYPPALLNALLWGAEYPLVALALEAAAHVLLAAWGAYAFARRALGVGVLAALVGAICFAFSGYLTGFPLEQVTIAESAAWLPWLLLGLHVAGGAGARRWWGSAGAALALGLALLAGHPQTGLYLALSGAAYALFRLWQARRAGRGWGAALPLVLPVPLGVMLAAAQLLPTLAFIGDSTREATSYAFVQQGLSVEELATLLLPNIISGTPLYVGIATLLLAALAWGDPRQRAAKGFWSATALASLLFALGGGLALFDLLYLGVPGVGQARSPERGLLLWAWALALLAAWGVEALRSAAGRAAARQLGRWLVTALPALLLPWLLFWWLRATAFSNLDYYDEVYQAYFSRYSFFLLMALLALAALALAARRGAARWLFPALLVLDLFSINRAFHLGPPVGEALRPANSVVAALQARLPDDPGRVAVSGAVTPRDNDGMRWSLPLLTSNEPLQLAVSDRALAVAAPWAQLQMAGARYLVADRDLAAEAPEAYELLVADPDGSFLHRTRPEMPYAWLVGEAEVVSAELLPARLAEPTFEPHRTALLAAPLAPLGDAAAGSVAIEAWGPRARLDVTNGAAAPLLLVIAEPAARGWRATLDGTPVEWMRANGWNVALLVPPGEHEVTLDYVQPGWAEGRALSVLALAGLAALLLAPVLARRRKR